MPNSDMPFVRLSRQQKTGFVLLLIFGVLAVGLGLLQMRNTIYGPFALYLNPTAAPGSAAADEATRLQRTDTDADGLSDYEELEFYQTSPYLPDTDSDGARDKAEVDSGEDPLCPAGEECRAAAPSSTTSSTLLGTIAGQQNDPLQILEGIGQALDPSGLVTRGPGGVPQLNIEALINDPVALRQLIETSGQFTPEQLQGLDDETLLSIARDAAKQSGAPGGDSDSAGASTLESPTPSGN